MKKIAFLFPGQGAQSVGMGKDFYDRYTSAREVFQQGDEILQRSLSKIIFNGPNAELTETSNSQTGIYLNSMAILRVLRELFPQLTPLVCAGLSLGEYSAITAVGCLPFEKSLPLVQFRGEVMHKACEETKGTMAAIFGLSAEEVEEMVQALNLPNSLWVANFNTPKQTVISGTLKGVEAGILAAKAKGAKRIIPLKVHGAFHSGLMQEAKERLAEKIDRIELLDSSIGLVMNAVGQYVCEKEQLRLCLIDQVTSPVRWAQGISAMDSQVDLFIEIGCGKTLAGMNRQIGVTAQTFSINRIEDIELLGDLLCCS